ncbi:MAG: hypothetical protein AAB242_09690 [Nitrospirota bacterium]
MRTEPPPNPLGGKTLIVDANDGDAYPRPSAALLDAGEQAQVFVRPGIYEDKVFITGRRFIWWGPVETRCRFFPVVEGLSISSGSQAVASPASRFDTSEAIRTPR